MNTKNNNPGCFGGVTGGIAGFFLVLSGCALIYRIFNELPANRAYNLSTPVLVIILFSSIFLFVYNYSTMEKIRRREEHEEKVREKITSTCPKCSSTEFTIESIVIDKIEGREGGHSETAGDYDIRYSYKYDEVKVEEFRKCRNCNARFAKREVTKEIIYDCKQIHKHGAPTPAYLPSSEHASSWELIL